MGAGGFLPGSRGAGVVDALADLDAVMAAGPALWKLSVGRELHRELVSAGTREPNRHARGQVGVAVHLDRVAPQSIHAGLLPSPAPILTQTMTRDWKCCRTPGCGWRRLVHVVGRPFRTGPVYEAVGPAGRFGQRANAGALLILLLQLRPQLVPSSAGDAAPSCISPVVSWFLSFRILPTGVVLTRLPRYGVTEFVL